MPSEFSLIDQYLRPLTAGFEPARGLRDDAGYIVVPEGQELVVTKDLIVSGVHFMGDEPPALIAQKALRVNLSDLAAKGAVPYAYSLGLAVPVDDGRWTVDGERWIAGFVSGLAADQKQFGIGLLGGDTTRSKSDLVISVTMYGFIPQGQHVLRSGAREGDGIYVTGTIGDAGLGLHIICHSREGGNPGTPASAGDEAYFALTARGLDSRLRGNDKERDGSDTHTKFLIDRYQLPQPRMNLIRHLKQQNAVHAAIDVSDGLLGDLRHICRESGVGASLQLAQMPLSLAAKDFIKQSLLSLADLAAMGDDYEILFTAPDAAWPSIEKLSAELNLPIARIGDITAGNTIEVFDRDKKMDITRWGYEH